MKFLKYCGFILLTFSNVLVTIVQCQLNSSIEYCEGMMNYYMVDRKSCPYAVYFGKSLPECLCISGIYQAQYDDCSTKYARGDGYCFRTVRPKGERLKSIQLVGALDYVHPQVLIATKHPGENSRLELIASTVNNTFGIHQDTPQKYTFTSLFATSAKVFTGIPKSSSEKKTGICIEPNPGPDYSCKATGPMTEADIIITKGSCKDELLDPQEMDTEECLPVRSEPECELQCDRTSGPNFYDPNCTDWQRRLVFENEYYDRRMKEHGLLTQLNEMAILQDMKPKRTFDLMKIMVDITGKFCPENYVMSSWIAHVVELFYVLYKGTEVQSIETMTEEDSTWITEILTSCSGAGYFVNLTNHGPAGPDTNTNGKNECDDNGIGGKAWGYCRKNGTVIDCDVDPIRIMPYYEKIGSKMKNKHYTPEIAWNVLDAIQAICFREFNSSYRMFHILQQSVEKLFTPRIRDIWYNPAYLQEKNSIIKSRLFGAGADEAINNLEVCIGSAYDIINRENKDRIGPEATEIPRLTRPKYEKYLTQKRKKRSTDSQLVPISRTTETYCIKDKATAPQWFSKDCSKIAQPTEQEQTAKPIGEGTDIPIPGPPADYEIPDTVSE